jgi:hypothetical protein
MCLESDLVLLLGDGRAGRGVADVGLVDRLALDADLFALHRHGLLDLVGDHVLAQPRAAALAAGLAHAQLFLRAGHRVVGGGAGGVTADRASVGRLATVALGQARVRAGLGVVEPVVAVEAGLLLLRQVAVGLGLGSVLDLLPALLPRHSATAESVGLMCCS